MSAPCGDEDRVSWAVNRADEPSFVAGEEQQSPPDLTTQTQAPRTEDTGVVRGGAEPPEEEDKK